MHDGGLPVNISPGPPHYQYGATLVDVPRPDTVQLDIMVKYLRVDSEGDRDYGLGLRRRDGWLIQRQLVRLAGIVPVVHDSHVGSILAFIRGCLPTGRCVVRTRRSPNGLWSGVIWPEPGNESVNDRLIAVGMARAIY